jgi:hypothetical protein
MDPLAREGLAPMDTHKVYTSSYEKSMKLWTNKNSLVEVFVFI